MPDTTSPVSRPASVITAAVFGLLAVFMLLYAISWPGPFLFVLALLTAVAAGSVVEVAWETGELRDDFDPIDWAVTDLDRQPAPAVLIIAALGWQLAGARWWVSVLLLVLAVFLLVRAHLRALRIGLPWNTAEQPEPDDAADQQEMDEPAPNPAD